ncbi:hypothetical protein BIY27_26110 [Gibbsiella quercinecans]|uniref:hypothetical protein n=1 Tax=Gibbsiella quercinecans TaxID=929813 RepID=UPI000F288295|nr:hypothetical protein [Gibbsiella quercinecans]RLM02044.1 hypothetical protein BIY27_26110 [Gibbsiella quercinecans]
MSQTYLKMKMQSDRRLALTITKALQEVHSNLVSTINDVKAGSSRLVNYGSCLSSDNYYRQTCRETWQEDTRLVMSLSEIYKRNDVVLDMVQIYFQKILTRVDQKTANDINEHVVKIIGVAAAHASGKFSKLALASTIAKIITNSHAFKESHIKIVNNFSSWFVTGTSLYANAKIASDASRKLIFQDSDYYHALYRENIEMLYFLIEPQMSKIIYQINSGSNH